MEQTSKIGRGLGEELRNCLQGNETLNKKVKQREYFLGIRNNYFNIYYRGASMGRFKLSGGKLVVQVDNKYLGNNNDRTDSLSIEAYIGQIDIIRKNIDEHKQQYPTKEKDCQQNLVNNSYNKLEQGVVCIDMEYVRQVEGRKDENGRFDMVTLSTAPNKSGKYEVTLVELKVGCGSLPDDSPKAYGICPINVDQQSQKLKSGLLGHIGKYYRYLKDEAGYEQLKGEILAIISDYNALGVLPKDIYEGITADDFESQPKVAFVIYSGSRTLEKVKETTANYLFEGRSRSSEYNVQKCLRTEDGMPIDVRKPLLINGKSYHFNFYFRDGVAIEQKCTLALDEPYQF